MAKFTKAITLNIKLEEKDKDELARLAYEDDRTISNYCRTILMQHLAEVQNKDKY